MTAWISFGSIVRSTPLTISVPSSSATCRFFSSSFATCAFPVPFVERLCAAIRDSSLAGPRRPTSVKGLGPAARGSVADRFRILADRPLTFGRENRYPGLHAWLDRIPRAHRTAARPALDLRPEAAARDGALAREGD